MNNYGLIGKKLSHSFSKEFFNHKFKKLKLSNYSYKNFELDNISSIRELIVKNNLLGLNITIPYKKKILKETPLIVSIEASESTCWKKYTSDNGLNFGINSFGKSAPYKKIYDYFGLNSKEIIKKIKKRL